MTMAKATAEPAVITPEQRALAVRERFVDMINVVPDVESDGGLSILEAIMDAAVVTDIDAPWESNGSEELLDVLIEVDSIAKAESDFTEGLGFYLVVRGRRLDTDAPTTFTVGSSFVIAELVKAHVLGGLPLIGRIVKAARPSKNGYFALHFEVGGIK